MRILVIDDKASEIQRATEAANSLGWEVVSCDTSIRQGRCVNNTDWIELVDNVDCVATDLMWDHASLGEKPMGLLVVIHCLSRGKPVAVCTNASDYTKGHHGEAIGFIHDGYYTSSGTPYPFALVETKNWEHAMQLLSERLGQQ